MMEQSTFYMAVMSRILGPPIAVIPPNDTDIFNFAAIPTERKFDGWVDPAAPFPEITIPKNSQWLYSAHIVQETGDPTCPLRAGLLVGGPFLSLAEAERAVSKAEGKGFFGCIFAAVVNGQTN